MSEISKMREVFFTRARCEHYEKMIKYIVTFI